MGTSKGYIAPSTPNWAKVKRGVTAYTGDPSESNIKQATTEYAKAINSDNYIIGNIADVFSNIIGFILSSNSPNGVSGALKEIHREDILKLDSVEALTELMYHFANNGSTIDDSIALDCISNSFEILEIVDFNDISKIDANDFLKELVCQFAKQKFAQMFDKQIRNKCANIQTANLRLADMQEYIYETLKLKFENKPELIKDIDPHKLAESEMVRNIITSGFKLLESCYYE